MVKHYGFFQQILRRCGWPIGLRLKKLSSETRANGWLNSINFRRSQQDGWVICTFNMDGTCRCLWDQSINHISIPLILWDWPILLFMKFRGLLDCHPEMRIRKRFGIKWVLQWNGIRFQLFFFLVTRFCWNHQMFLEAGLCSMVMFLLHLEFRSSHFRFSLKLPNKICSVFKNSTRWWQLKDFLFSPRTLGK